MYWLADIGLWRSCRAIKIMTTSFQRKILDRDALRAVVAGTRAKNQRIVQCHGCFDVVHPGHIRYLEFARRQGDLLIVSVTGDLQMDKGSHRPYIPQEFRAENLAALMFVDYVYINPSPSAEEILELVRPDIYVKGREYECSTDPGLLAEKAVVEKHGGRLIFSSGEVVFSSTDLIGRMPKASESQLHRMSQFCERHEIQSSNLIELVERFRDLNVLVVGDIIIDRYVHCDVLGVAGEGPMLSLAEQDERRFVGGAGIVARHAAGLGANVTLVAAGAKIGNDSSRLVQDVLGKEGVSAHFVQERPAFVEKTRFLAEDAKLFKIDKAQRIPLDSVAERAAALFLEQQSKIADVVIFCDFGYGTITASFLARVLPTLRQNVRILSADVSGGRGGNLLHFRHVDLLCPTEREARDMLNDHAAGLSAIAWDLLQRTQARHLFLTLEKRGMLIFERPSQHRESADWSSRLISEQIPALGDHAVDHLGCGDALLAASTLALAAGANPYQAAYVGSAAAAIEVGLLGNVPIDASRLTEWVRQRREISASASTFAMPVAHVASALVR